MSPRILNPRASWLSTLDLHFLMDFVIPAHVNLDTLCSTDEADCPSSSPADWRRKIIVNLADSTNSELCPLCGLTLGSELCFNVHINCDTSTGYVMYECRICKRNNSIKDSIRTHLRTHTGEKLFSCPHCPYRAIQSSVMREHNRTHEKGETMSIGAVIRSW